MHNWSTFTARTNHGQIQTHKTHHGPNLGEVTTFPLIVYFVPSHGTSTQMSFCPKTPKWKSRNSHNWDSRDFGPIALRAYLWLRWGLKKSCSPCQELSNDMSHVTCTQGNQGDSWLLMVESQIANLIPDPSFGHNLCFKCPNGLCKPILNIYVARAFQWYKKFPNPMGFDLYNHFLKIRESIENPFFHILLHS